MSEIGVYLLDIEGTTSPVSLVSEQLFPYARRHLESYLREHGFEEAVRADLTLLAEENRRDAEAPCMDGAAHLEQAMVYLQWLMDRDRKSTALKSLQGKIWRRGYEAGELVGTVFADVPEALARWAAKARVAIYSSGSVEAQRLIFGHSSVGDLTGCLSGYFDTRVGPKTAAASYRAIAAALGVTAGEVLFVSDALRELEAAREAGCATRLAVREGNAPVDDTQGHAVIGSFAEIP